jgi:hypothetical protein
MRIIILFILLVLFVGCVNTEIVRPDILANDTTKDIVVTTKSGKSIRLYAGDYRMVQVDTTKYINGKGTILKENNKILTTPFNGSISFAEIIQLETHEKSVFYYSAYYLFAGAVVFILFIGIAFHGRGPGG